MNSVEKIAVIQAETIGKESLALAKEFEGMMIVTPYNRTAAGEALAKMMSRRKDIREAFDDLCNSAHKHWKTLCARRNHFYDPVDEAIKYLKSKIIEYDMEMEKERVAQETRLRAEAVRHEEERKLEEALNATPEEAEKILSEPIQVAPVVIPKNKPKDVVYREIWVVEVTDMKALVDAVSAGTVDLLAVLPNETWLRKKAGMDRTTFSITGVKAFPRYV